MVAILDQQNRLNSKVQVELACGKETFQKMFCADQKSFHGFKKFPVQKVLINFAPKRGLDRRDLEV